MIRTIGLLALTILARAGPLRAQDDKYLFRPDIGPVGLSVSYQYVDLPSLWSINYFGVSAEINSSKPIGLSGSIMVGRASNGTGYVHFPAIGLIVFPIVVALQHWEVKDLLVIFLENVHYNARVNERFVISPYLNLLGLDLTTSGSTDNSLMSLGPGLSLKYTFSGGVVVRPDVCLKYYFEPQNQFGFCSGISIGYIF
jgi:hypothetical protein